jgi:ABC-2 type transport system permease protein
MANATTTSATTAFGRAARAELTRLPTVKSTLWSLLAGAALMLFVGGAAGSQGPESGEVAPIWYAAEFAILPGQFAFLLIVVLAVTGEFATGTIRSSLQWIPRRGVLMAARIVVPVLFAVGCAVVLAAATDLLAWWFLGDQAQIVLADIVRSLGRVALIVVVGGLLAVGFGMLLRSTAGALITIFLLIFALPLFLGNIGVPWLTTISEHLPGSVMISLLAVTDEPRDATTVAAVLIAWPSFALLLGGRSLVRRDTT